MGTEAEDVGPVDASINFILSDGQVYIYLYLSKDHKPEIIHLADMLKNINASLYLPQIFSVMNEYAAQTADSKQYLEDVKTKLVSLIRESVSAIENKNKDKLVVRPTEFVRYPNYAGH